METGIADHAALIVRIDELCEDICVTVHEAEWEAAGKLLSQRQRLLERLYSIGARTAAEIDTLRALGQRVIDCDRELALVAATARKATEQELRGLQTGRRAAAAYADNA